MRYGYLPEASERISRLVMGSMVFSVDRQALADELLDRFLEAGGSAVDTARVYAGGTSEIACGIRFVCANWVTSIVSAGSDAGLLSSSVVSSFSASAGLPCIAATRDRLICAGAKSG